MLYATIRWHKGSKQKDLRCLIDLWRDFRKLRSKMLRSTLILCKIPVSGLLIFLFFPQWVACTWQSSYNTSGPFQSLVLCCGSDIRPSSSVHYSLFSWFSRRKKKNPSPPSWHKISSHLLVFKETNSLHHNILASPDLLACLEACLGSWDTCFRVKSQLATDHSGFLLVLVQTFPPAWI